MPRTSYPLDDAKAAVLTYIRDAERRQLRSSWHRKGAFPLHWCYSAVDLVRMPDGGHLPLSRIKAAVDALVADGTCVRPAVRTATGWRLSPAEFAALEAELAAEQRGAA